MTGKTAGVSGQHPPASSGGLSSAKRAEAADAHTRLFVVMAADMSWQLAIVVLVPILGGHALDDRFGSSPWLTLSGLGVAAIGVFGVLISTAAKAGSRIASQEIRKQK